MIKKTIKDLNEIYRDSDSVDKDLRAEQRTNIELVAGDHYGKKNSSHWNRLRESKQLAPEARLRLTKNHMGKITKLYRNAILSHAPGVKILPKNESEIQDQKVAELHHAVWSDLKARHKLNKKIRTWVKDFVELGEVICKVFWDPNAGVQVGWEAVTDEMGDPIVDPNTGQYAQGNTPIMSGDLVFETIHAFDLRRDPKAKHMDESPYLIFEKMADSKELEKKYEGDEEKQKYVKESSEDTFRVFQTQNLSWGTNKGSVKVKEYYFRPCYDYPSGYFYITTDQGILEEGELPFGVWPICYENFDEITTSPRGYSIIRQLRPYQIEINRAASKIAEHQVTIGDTKVFLLSGSKPSSGASKPGIRYESITGGPPTVVPGQAGEQYFQYLNDQIAEMYRVADISEELLEMPAQADPYAMLFRSIRQKKKFSIYADKFESFLVDVCQMSLRLMKEYAPDTMVVQAVGRNEQVNIAEFKTTDDLGWQIVVDPVSDDMETSFGKQLTLNTIIQYIGQNLEKKDIGKMLRLSPYLNKEQIFNDMLVDYDSSVNDILALDRGEFPQGNKYENHKYLLEMAVARVKQPDFRFKPDNIKQMYAAKIQEHEMAIAKEAEEIKAAQSGFIPSGGYAVATDFYVSSDPNDPSKTKRLRVPSEALDWLVKQLDKQGSTEKALQQMPGGVQADIAQMIGMPEQQQAVDGGY